MRTQYNLAFHSILYNDMQEVCENSRLLMALVLRVAGDRWGLIALLTSYLMLNT